MNGSITLTDNIYNSCSSYTWRKEWISENESPWGIMEKFRLANSLNDDDLLRIFSLNYINKKNYRPKKDKNLLVLDYLDENIMKSVFGINIKCENNRNIEKISGIIADLNLIKRFFRNIVYYCPECMKNAYHSIWFQYVLVQYCPYHNQKLINCCPNCKTKIPYEINSSWSSSPYKCKCGYLLWSNTAPKHYFWNTFLRSGYGYAESELLSWERLDSNSKALKNIYFFKKANYSNSHDLLDYIRSIITKSKQFLSDDVHYNVVSINKIIKQKNENLEFDFKKKNTDQRYISFYHDIYSTYRLIYSATARYLRKKVLYEHKICINDFKKNVIKKSLKHKEICPYAYAYFMWRKNIEGRNSITNIENGHAAKRYYNENSAFPIVLDSELVQELFYDWKNRFYDNNILKKNVVCKWVISRIISHILINRFYEWLNYSKSIISDEFNDTEVFLNDEEIPFFIVKYPDDENGNVEFHWWDNRKHDSQNLFNNLRCPNKKRISTDNKIIEI